MPDKPRSVVFRDADIIAALGSIVRLNTKHYQTDFFKHDIEALAKAAQSGDSEDRRLLWMSRLCGTWCFREREVFLRDTDAHFTWLNYGDSEQHRVLAYAVEITGERDGVIRGDIYQLDYRQHADRVTKAALPTETITATMGDGTERSLSYERYCGYKNTDLQPHNHGGIASIRHEPKDSAEFIGLLQEERAGRGRGARPGDIDRHIKKLVGAEKQSIRQQLAEGEEQAARHNAGRTGPEHAGRVHDDR